MEQFKSLSDQVYEYVMKRIQRGEIKAGDKLTELALSDEIGLSRSPIREALIQLSADGILENSKRKGFFVREISREESANNYAIYAQLDAFAAELAMDSLSDDELVHMEQLIERMELAIAQQNYENYENLQREFHETYVKKCGNLQLIEMLHDLQKRTPRSSQSTRSLDDFYRDLASHANKQHKEIVSAFRHHDVNALRNTIIAHWTNRGSATQ